MSVEANVNSESVDTKIGVDVGSVVKSMKELAETAISQVAIAFERGVSIGQEIGDTDVNSVSGALSRYLAGEHTFEAGLTIVTVVDGKWQMEVIPEDGRVVDFGEGALVVILPPPEVELASLLPE